MTFVVVAVLVRRAHADNGPGLAYLYDGGAVPLFWVPLIGGLIISSEVTPRSTPLWFSPNEGGAKPASWEVPGWTLAVAGGGAAAAIALAGDSSRWHHAKGLAEALATSELATDILKPLFGRHRPDWTPTTTDPSESESFPSGHSTAAFSIAMYGALYLHDHAPSQQLWADAVMFTGASLVAAERVYHNRHFVSDVVAGALLGSATSLLVYRYQEAQATRHGARTWSIVPALDATSHTLSITGSF